jgi:serine/threonine-protein kinase
MSSSDDRTSAETILPSTGDHEPPRDLTGVTLGDFHVNRLLGRGGMGEVYLATQESLNRPVALKVLLANYSANPTYLGRLKKEATAIAKLNHPNIVHVYMLGCVDDIHFIVMEYVEGTNLRDYIIKKGALELPLAYSIMKQTGQAIAAAGAVGLVHRDLKPENILMTRKGRVKVTDFGLCRDEATGNVHLTQTGVTMGTPLYMSPEQAQGHEVDHRSDLYSLGVTFYHMLAGAPPFHGDTALAVALKQVREAPRSMLLNRPDLPADLDRLVLKMIAKSPSDRYQSAGEMLADLAKLRDSMTAGSMTTISDTTQGSGLRGVESRAAAAGNGASSRRTPLKPAGLGAPGPAAGWRLIPAEGLARLSWTMAISTSLVCLLGGGVAGWSARQPDVLAVKAEPGSQLPGLWIEPRWSTIPKQSGPEDQLRYAIFQAPADDWAPACLAVPGYFPHAHEQISKAYTQLARILYRRGDQEGLAALESELAQWKDAKGDDQDLIHVVRIAIKLGKADFAEVMKEFRKLTREAVPDMYDPAVVEMSLEICTDAIGIAVRAGIESVMVQELRQVQLHLVRQLYRIELPKSNRTLQRGTLKSP